MIAAEDLGAAQRRLSAAGLEFAAGGRHPFGTRNALAVSPRRHAYLELINADRDAEGDLALAVRRGGLVSWAVGVSDIDAAVSAVTAAGFDCSPVTSGQRRGADGALVQWRTATIGAGFGQSELPFLIEWPNRDGHRTGLVPDPAAPELTDLSIGSRAPDGPAALFRALGLDVDADVRVTVTGGAVGLQSAVLRRPDGTETLLSTDRGTDPLTVAVSQR